MDHRHIEDSSSKSNSNDFVSIAFSMLDMFSCAEQYKH